MDAHEKLGAELALLGRVLKALHTKVVEESDFPAEVAGAYVLGRLATLGPVRLTTLAKEMGLDTSSCSRHVSALERRGLLAKERDTSDLRAQQLVLTEAGELAVERLREARARELARLLPGWTAKDLHDLSARLGRLNDDLAAMRDTTPTARQETA